MHSRDGQEYNGEELLREREPVIFTISNKPWRQRREKIHREEYIIVMSYAASRFIICVMIELNCVRHKGCVGICGILMLCRTCVA